MLVVLVLIAVAVCLLLGAVRMSVLAARQPGRGEDSFRCRMRVEWGLVNGLEHAYPRRWQHAVWVHDVLLVRRGRVFVRILPLPVEAAEVLSDISDDLVVLRLRLDDGAVVAAMAERHMATALVGPFLMAELEHMNNATSRPRGGGRR